MSTLYIISAVVRGHSCEIQFGGYGPGYYKSSQDKERDIRFLEEFPSFSCDSVSGAFSHHEDFKEKSQSDSPPFALVQRILNFLSSGARSTCNLTMSPFGVHNLDCRYNWTLVID